MGFQLKGVAPPGRTRVAVRGSGPRAFSRATKGAAQGQTPPVDRGVSVAASEHACEAFSHSTSFAERTVRSAGEESDASPIGASNARAGYVLGGKYRLLGALSRGAMGTIWRAEHVALGCHVAVKLIEAEGGGHAEAQARFLIEARTSARLRSAHVVQILDYGVDSGLQFLVMELLEGESLASRLARRGRLSRAETARVLGQVAQALERAHTFGVVHRDLSPNNVFLTMENGKLFSKLLDFGIAKSSAEQASRSLTTRGTILGTPCYMSPEQIEGGALDARTDIWALGVIAFECLLGLPPFRGDTFGSLVLAICARPIPIPSTLAATPTAFDAWFARACARDKSERFESALLAARELRRSLRGG